MTDDVPYFPQISDQQAGPFLVLAKLLKQNPKLLEHPECPYSDEIREIFANFGQPAGSSAKSTYKDKFERLAVEAEALFNELKAYKSQLGLGDQLDNAEMMAYFRTATSLLDKLTAMQERTVGLRKVGEFQETIMEILEDVMTPDQRTQILQRLNAVLEAQS